jgi:DNA primase
MEFLSSHDASAMQAQLDAAVPLMDFVFTKRLAGYDLSAPGRRVKALDEMAQLLAPLKNSVLLDEYATQLADALGMDVSETKRVIREKPVKAAEPEVRERHTEVPAGARPRQAVRSVPDPEDDYVPVLEDYVPADAYDGAEPVAPAGGTPFSVSRMLSGDERMQVAVERELLSMLAAMPDEVRPYADRLADVMWADARHEGMAWAMLATPEGTAPADVVAAATAVEPEAPQILSSGRVVSSPGMDSREKVAFLVDSVELYSCKRRVREIKARLRQAGDAGGQDAEALFEQATALQKRINALTKKLSAVVEQ